jgi:hypothetical protein
VIVNLIANTAPKEGLPIRAELDGKASPIGIKVSDEQLAAVNLTPDGFHGDWNHSINPVRRKK